MQPYDDHQRAAKGISARCAVATLSDTRTLDTDKSGRRIRDLLKSNGHTVADYQLLPDEPARLRPLLRAWIDREDVDVILTNGGTGISRRDATIDVIESMLTLPLPGFGELFRMLSWGQIGSGAMMSRAAGGLAGRTVVFALPGSTPAVELAMEKLILPELAHLLREARK